MRPCDHPEGPPQPDRCRVCWLYVNSTPHRERWDATAYPPPAWGWVAPPPQRPGLGDLVAQGLAAVGVTKELAERVLGGPCGCQERQQALNALGDSVLATLGLAPKAGPGNSSPGSR